MTEESFKPTETWDPFNEFDPFRGWPSIRLLGSPREHIVSAARWSPSMDVSETDTHFVATVELAGAKKEDVNVEIEDGVLTIRGQKRSERQETTEERRYSERCFGTFTRAFTLPSNADPDDIAATFTDGVLKVEVAKTGSPKAKAIQVH